MGAGKKEFTQHSTHDYDPWKKSETPSAAEPEYKKLNCGETLAKT